jgi:predicted PurR-regulated permease PerM
MSQTSEAKRVATLLFYGAVVLIAVLAYRIVRPFLVQIGWAVVLTVCLAPLQARLTRRLGPTRSAAVLTILVLLVLIVPTMLVAQMLVHEGSRLVDYIHVHLRDSGGPMALFHIVWQWLHRRLPFLPTEQEVVQQLSDSLGGLASQVASHAGYIVKGALAFLFGLVITLAILFFMLRDAPKLAAGVRRLLPFGRERNSRLLELIRDIVSTSVTSTLVIAVIQGILGGITFLLLGVPGALLWGCLMTVLAVLPAVGGAIVWVPAAIWLALSGSWVKGIVLALVGTLVLTNVDNVVRPLMLSGTARMSTLVLIVSLLGGVSAFGFIGIVLGPVVGAVFTALIETYAMMPEEEAEALPGTPAATVVAGAIPPVPPDEHLPAGTSPAVGASGTLAQASSESPLRQRTE